MGNRLNITKWQGKKQRLTTAINKACREEYYFQLYLTPAQYLMLERTKELSMYPWQDYPPEDRIYISDNGAMEVRLSKWYHPITDTIQNILASIKHLW